MTMDKKQYLLYILQIIIFVFLFLYFTGISTYISAWESFAVRTGDGHFIHSTHIYRFIMSLVTIHLLSCNSVLLNTIKQIFKTYLTPLKSSVLKRLNHALNTVKKQFDILFWFELRSIVYMNQTVFIWSVIYLCVKHQYFVDFESSNSLTNSCPNYNF